MTVGIRNLSGPPSSPPNFLRTKITTQQITASIQKTVTENASAPGSTLKVPPLTSWYTAAIVHASPIPRNTLTALLPVMLPMEESAYWSFTAATLLANVSGER